MHRYDELEKLYYKNKIKKYSFLAAAVLFVIAGGFYGYNYFNTKKNSSKPQIKVDFKKITTTAKEKADINTSEKKTLKSAKKIETNKPKKEYNITKIANNKTEPVDNKKETKKEEPLTPNLSFVVPKIKEETVKKELSVKKVTETKKTTTKKEEKRVQADQQLKVLPVIKEEKININELISSFNKEPKYDTAMVISKYYFDRNDFKNAKLWALKANNIDPAKYESWKMFALILLKKNDKIKAKEVLKIYLNDYGDNEEIYKLLRSIDE